MNFTRWRLFPADEVGNVSLSGPLKPTPIGSAAVFLDLLIAASANFDWHAVLFQQPLACD
jgi:hypothetical protein